MLPFCAQVPGVGCLLTGEEEQERYRLTYGMPGWVAGIEMCRSEDGLGVFIHNAVLLKDGAGTALLAAMRQPPGGIDLLWLQACSLGPAAFKGSAAHLASAKRLVVQACRGSGAPGALGPAVGALVQQAPQLRSLDITCSRGSRQGGGLSSGLPRAIGQLSHLTSLELYGTRLPHLSGMLDGVMPKAAL